MGNGTKPGQQARDQLHREGEKLSQERAQLSQEAEKLMPRYTEEHRQAHINIKAAEAKSHQATDEADRATTQAKQARDQADKLEAQFKAKVDDMERTGKPDPNPAQTRQLATAMDKAAEDADSAEATASDATHAREIARIEFRRAYDANEEAQGRDPVYQQEIKPKLDDLNRRADEHRDQENEWRNQYETDDNKYEPGNPSAQAAPDGDADDTLLAATSADATGTDAAFASGASDDGLIGDEATDSSDGGDSGMAAFGGTGDLDAGTSTPDSDGSLAASTNGTTPTDDEFQSGSVEADSSGWDSSAGDATADDAWAETDQGLEPQVAVADPPEEPEFEEFADDSAGTTG